MSAGFDRMGPAARVAAAELHNRLAGRLVGEIVRPIVANGGSPAEIMVLLESVTAGVLLVLQRLAAGGLDDDALADLLAANVRQRLAELRAERQRETH